MRITCPQCQAGYDVDPEKIPADGLRVRCPQCDRVFSVRVAQSTSTTMSGQPPVAGPVPTMVGRAAPSGRRPGMTMVGMAPPPPPAASIQSDDPRAAARQGAPTAGAAAAGRALPAAEVCTARAGAAPRRLPPRRPPERLARAPTGAIPLPSAAGLGSTGASAGRRRRSRSTPPRRSRPPGRASPPSEPVAEPVEPVPEASPTCWTPDQPAAEPAPVEPPRAGAPEREPSRRRRRSRSPSARSRSTRRRPDAADPFAALAARAAALPARRRGAGDALHGRWRGAPPPPAPPPRRTAEAGYRVRRPSGRVFGPFSEREIVEMLGKGELNGNEDVSAGDGDEWIAIGAAGPSRRRSSG